MNGGPSLNHADKNSSNPTLEWSLILQTAWMKKSIEVWFSNFCDVYKNIYEK